LSTVSKCHFSEKRHPLKLFFKRLEKSRPALPPESGNILFVDLFRNVSHVLAALFNDRADFQRRWDEAGKTGSPQRWAGDWASEVNRHRGDLKCLLTKTESGEFDAASTLSLPGS
jgi:hypothetical protein